MSSKSFEFLLGRFFRRDDGAVTVDWVVLTAAIVGICISAIVWVTDGTHSYGERVGDHISSQDVKTSY